MVIGFDGSRAFVSKRTGTEEYSFQLLMNLAKIDTVNNYIIYLRPGNKIESNDWPANFVFKTLNFSFLWTQIGLSLQTFKDELDVLFVPSHTLPLIKKPGLKTIMTVHDLGAEYLPNMHQFKQLLYLKFITRLQLKRATHLIAVSLATKEDLLKKIGIRADRVSVVYEGIDQKLFKRPKNGLIEETKRKYHINKSYFLFIGSIQPRKNLSRLIYAFKIFLDKTQQDFDLVLAGGSGWDNREVYSLPKELKIEEKVKFPGFISWEEKIALFYGAQAFTFPSLFEGFGLPILESFACRCPVLTSNTSSMPEVAGDGAILVDPLDSHEIASGMIEILDPSKRNFLKAEALKQLKQFSWEKCARETLRVLEKAYN